MGDFEKHAEEFNIKSLVITMILGAFGFLVALAWRDAIKDTIDLFVPSGEGLIYTYIAAILVTVIAVVVAFVLLKLQNIDLIPDKYEEKVKKRIKRNKEATDEEKGKKKIKRKKRTTN
ncbi:MAG: hypothetical protein ISS93_02370 [Candidatus Aenigmarchaeota archaeon]|nr:hypothetical protein [Candidatus Aenigmarchaeota archaeon]